MAVWIGILFGNQHESNQSQPSMEVLRNPSKIYQFKLHFDSTTVSHESSRQPADFARSDCWTPRKWLEHTEHRSPTWHLNINSEKMDQTLGGKRKSVQPGYVWKNFLLWHYVENVIPIPTLLRQDKNAPPRFMVLVVIHVFIVNVFAGYNHPCSPLA